MTKQCPMITVRSADGISVVDVRTLPEEIKTSIIIASFAVAAEYGNGDADVEGIALQARLGDLQQALNETDAHLHKVAALDGGPL